MVGVGRLCGGPTLGGTAEFKHRVAERVGAKLGGGVAHRPLVLSVEMILPIHSSRLTPPIIITAIIGRARGACASCV